ncbi:MAG: FRG domain-containing protein [Bacteroidota bacterium]
MKYPESEISSIGQLIEKLQDHVGAYASPVWFRGHSKNDWKPEPKLMRIEPLPSETYYLNRFKQDASIILTHHPKGEFEWMFLMQHYGVPTRFLEWLTSVCKSCHDSQHR